MKEYQDKAEINLLEFYIEDLIKGVITAYCTKLLKGSPGQQVYSICSDRVQ